MKQFLDVVTPQKSTDWHSTAVQSPSVSTLQLHESSSLLPQFQPTLARPEVLANKLRALEQELVVEEPVREAEVDSEEEATGLSLEWCPHCGCETTAAVEFRPSQKTFYTSLGIALTGGVLGCFLLPYVTTSCKQGHKVCTHCKHSLS